MQFLDEIPKLPFLIVIMQEPEETTQKRQASRIVRKWIGKSNGL